MKYDYVKLVVAGGVAFMSLGGAGCGSTQTCPKTPRKRDLGPRGRRGSSSVKSMAEAATADRSTRMTSSRSSIAAPLR